MQPDPSHETPPSPDPLVDPQTTETAAVERQPSRSAAWVARGAVVIALSLLWIGSELGRQDEQSAAVSGEEGSEPGDAELVGRPAPLHFTMKDMNGADVRLASFKGRPILLNFWATWCGPCRAEAPQLQALWQKYKDRGVVFVGIDQADTTESALSYLKEYKIDYANGPYNGIVAAYRIQGLPTTMIINRDGVITDSILSPIDPRNLEDRLEAQLSR